MRLQVEIEALNVGEAINIASKALNGGADIICAGTPLIISEGIKVINELRKNFPNAIIAANMKITEAGFMEASLAAQAGADIVSVLASASDDTIDETLKAADQYNCRIIADLENITDKKKRITELKSLGVKDIRIHHNISADNPLDYAREHSAHMIASLRSFGRPTIKKRFHTEESFELIELTEDSELSFYVSSDIDEHNLLSFNGLNIDTIIVGKYITNSPDIMQTTSHVLAIVRRLEKT